MGEGKVLEKLSLRENPLGNVGASAIAEGIIKNRAALKEIDLSHRGVGVAGAR